LSALDKEIKDDDIRTRLGLPPREGRKKKEAHIEIPKPPRGGKSDRRATEMMDLLHEATVDPRPSGAAARQSREGGSVGDDLSETANDRAAAPPRTPREHDRGRAGNGRRRAGSAQSAEAEHKQMESETELGTPLASQTKKRRGRPPKSTGASDEFESESPLSGPVAKRARYDDQGRIVSIADGRALVCNNKLRQEFPSTYRNPANTRLWCGQSLDLGQAFKLAVWTHYGSQMPVDKNGNFLQRKALFRTAAYYALDPDGKQDKYIMDHPDFADLLWIMLLAAKQMRYNLLVDGRIFFGDNVFTHFRASKKYQGEFGILKYTQIWSIRI
jgi:hypothetical protein